MKFLKITMTLILSTSVVFLVSAPEPKKVESEFLTILYSNGNFSKKIKIT